MQGKRRTNTTATLALLLLAGGAIWWLYQREPAAAVEAAPAEESRAAVQWVASGESEEIALDLRLDRRAAIAGAIKDEHDRPIAGARVCARPESERLASSETRFSPCTISGRDGHYRIENLFGVRHRVVASAPRFIPGLYVRGEGEARRETVDLRPGMQARDIDITLQGGGVEVRGVVKDLSGGPIEGAQVTVSDAITFSAADGAFTAWVKPGGAWAWAIAEGYTSGHDSGTAPGHAFEIFLTPEAVIIGKVVRAGDGASVEGAKVSTASGGGGWGHGSAFTDAGGNFRIDGLEPGAYKPVAEADDAYGLAEEQVILGLGETSQPVVIKAHPAFLVEGTIAVAGGASCDSGSVSLYDRANDRRRRASSDVDGVARVQGVLAGTYEVQVYCRGLVPAERYPEVVVVDGPVTGVKWEVSRGQAIRGSVVDAAGKPVEKIRVSAQAQPDPSKPRAQTTGAWGEKTDAAGRFALAGLLPGAYRVSVDAWDPPRATPPKPLEVTLPEGKDLEDIRIALPATGEVRGRVRDPQGRPVGRIGVELSDGKQWQSVPAADDGTFRFEHVAAGEYRAVASRGWDSTARAPGTSDDDVQGEKVSVRGGSVESVDLVVEPAAGAITGVVKGEDGEPVADAFIEASRESDSAARAAGSAIRQGRWGSFGETPHLTDPDGRFSVAGLEAGKYTVIAQRKGGGEAIAEHVELGAEVTLTIASTARMSGTVALRGGEAPEEFRVVLVDEATGFQRRDMFYKTGGAWSFAELPAGKYKVRASAGAGSAEVEATMRAGEETTGVRIELAPRVTVRGKVVDTEGKPVPGVQVRISGSGVNVGGDPDRRNVTDEAGRFEVVNAPTGQVQVNVWPSGDEFDWAFVAARVEASRPEFELPAIELVRRRVKQGEAPGDLGFKLKESEAGADPLARKQLVAFVRAGGPAAQAGLQVGDEIVSVDGRPVSGANAYLFHGLTNVREGVPVTLGLARGASLRVVAGPRP